MRALPHKVAASVSRLSRSCPGSAGTLKLLRGVPSRLSRLSRLENTGVKSDQARLRRIGVTLSAPVPSK